jgi:hypothetical protein
MMPDKVGVWVNRAFLPLMGVMSGFVAVLNFRAAHDFHTIEKHLVFRERILHGFAVTDVVPSYPIPPTFPMWGYGWVLLLTTNKVLLIALQIALALWSVWFLLKVIDEIDLLNRWSRALLRISLIGCTPWYAYNSIDWSQSLATSCLILSIALLIRAARSASGVWWMLAISATCLGLNLNFASDLYLLPVPLACAYWWYAGPSRVAVVQGGVWLAVVGLTLVPWMIYSWRAVGVPLVKSTNQGHVLLLGLGQDPAGRFGMTYSDGDPLMTRMLSEQLGEEFSRRFYASCSYQADLVLRPAFLKIITRQPLDYLDLVRQKLHHLIVGDTGTYAGEFDEGANVGAFGIGMPVRRFTRRYSEEVGHALQLGTSLMVPAALWVAFRDRRRAWALLLVPIAYQYASCSVAALQPQYVSNLILLQLVVCAHGLGWSYAAILRESTI